MTSTEPRWLTDDEQQVWRDFLRVQARLASRLGRSLQETSGLSIADFEVLVALSEAPRERLRAYALASALEWEKSRLSHQLTRMERRGLVERQSCPSDARGAFVALTAAGRSAIAEAAPGHVADVRRLVFDALSPTQTRALGRISAVLLAGLADDDGAQGEPAGCDG